MTGVTQMTMRVHNRAAPQRPIMQALLVRLPNHLGDVCMALPALDLLATSGFALQLAGRRWARALFAAYPWPVIALDSTPFRDARTLRGAVAPATPAVLLTNSFSSALTARLARLRPIGYATDARRFLLAQALALPDVLPHMVEYYLALARAVSGAAVPAPHRLQLRLTTTATANARRLLAQAGVHGDYVVLCPVAVGRHHGQVKAWEGFTRLHAALLDRGLQIVACPGPGERAEVARRLPRARIVEETDVASFAALLGASRLVVANDSGPGHVAAAVGARLISVFGVTDPTRTTPWGPNVTRAGDAAGWPDYEAVESAVFSALDADPAAPSITPSSRAIM